MLTEKNITDQIQKVEYSKLGEKTAVCLITLKNGFEIVGTSACMKKENYDQEVGNKFAYEKAIDKIRELEGYKNS
ncbi:hypothetical protein BSK20_03475 [SR1 bacterium human oral taxon HOT-345]|nr:hypothetical protein BSK20_03475 [SR1 bacterium human oral taxon HOT-345]